MKFLIASDIHGSAYYCDLLMKAFDCEKADRIILLGDLLYHGPRNDLPRDYNPKSVIAMLNEKKNLIMAVRGNCEAEVDQMVLQFPVLAEYALLTVGDKIVFITHGHKFNQDNVPPLKDGDILLHGHTHIPACIEHETYTYMNPGSTSIPKAGNPHSYMTLEDGHFEWKNLETGEVYQTFN